MIRFSGQKNNIADDTPYRIAARTPDKVSTMRDSYSIKIPPLDLTKSPTSSGVKQINVDFSSPGQPYDTTDDRKIGPHPTIANFGYHKFNSTTRAEHAHYDTPTKNLSGYKVIPSSPSQNPPPNIEATLPAEQVVKVPLHLETTQHPQVVVYRPKISSVVPLPTSPDYYKHPKYIIDESRSREHSPYRPLLPNDPSELQRRASLSPLRSKPDESAVITKDRPLLTYLPGDPIPGSTKAKTKYIGKVEIQPDQSLVKPDVVFNRPSIPQQPQQFQPIPSSLNQSFGVGFNDNLSSSNRPSTIRSRSNSPLLQRYSETRRSNMASVTPPKQPPQ